MKNPVIDNKINSYIAENYRMRSLVTDALRCSIVLVWPLYGEKGLLALNDEPDFRDNFVNFGYEDLAPVPGKTNRQAFAGVVISAPYLNLTPALAPRVVSESGRLVYDSSVVDPASAKRNGMVLYALSPFDLPRGMKDRYYHCTAMNTTTFQGTDIVISDDDAASILGNASTIEALARCSVVVLAAEKR
jgi:hypothetical protein